MFGLALHLPPFRQLRCLDRHGLDGTNELAGECCIDTKPAEHHTPGHADRGVATIAAIDGRVVTSSIDDTQPTAAAAANQKAAEQGAAAAAGLRTILATIGVGGEQLLIAFKLLPVNVALMMILQQDLAVLERTIVAVGLARPAINDLGSIEAFAVGVGTGIEWVLQHRDDIAVADWRPVEGRHPLAVRWPRKMHLFCLERQMHLAGTAKFAEALKDPAGDLLNPAIRIEAETDLP